MKQTTERQGSPLFPRGLNVSNLIYYGIIVQSTGAGVRQLSSNTLLGGWLW